MNFAITFLFTIAAMISVHVENVLVYLLKFMELKTISETFIATLVMLFVIQLLNL